MSAENPYAAPSANLDRPDDYEGYGELNFFTVQGRIGRLRYLAWAAGLVLLVFPVFIVLGTIMAALGDVVIGIGGILMIIAYVMIIALGIFWMVQRLHDFNATGWLVLLAFIPLVPLIFMILPGTDGPNRYGKPPPPNSTGVKVLAALFLVMIVLGVVAAVAIPSFLAALM